MKKDLQWKIGGEAGFGIMTSGLIFSKVLTRAGYHVFDYIEYPSLIRGGHNTYQVRISEEKIYSQKKPVNILVALNKETFDFHKDELLDDSVVLYDKDVFQPDTDKNLFSVPWTNMVGHLELPQVMVNNVALGASVATLGISFDILLSVINDMFKNKGEKVVEDNNKAAKAGYDFVKKHFMYDFVKLEVKDNNRIILTGNEATALGAVAAGLNVYIAYPMTPSTSILHFMAAHGNEYGVAVKQPEDEISAINMAIGAGFAGARCMCATSGGGFCLMTEGIGLAAETETPVVIVNSQRPGPATGIPTWTEQGDLRLVLGAGQGEFPRFVIAPGDVDEAFYLIGQALNIAEKYQSPVVFMLDKYLSESHMSTERFDINRVNVERGNLLDNVSEDYKRFLLTDSGISPRVFPGVAVFPTNSDEHDEYGFTNEDSSMRIKMADKRMKKESSFLEEMPMPNIYGNKEANFTLVGFGSVKGPVLEALKNFDDVNFIHFTYISPFPSQKFMELVKDKKVLFIENNQKGMFAGWVRENTGFSADKLLKYDGRPFYPEEIINKINEMKNGI